MEEIVLSSEEEIKARILMNFMWQRYTTYALDESNRMDVYLGGKKIGSTRGISFDMNKCVTQISAN